jgi:hypothetical protein
MKRIIRTMLLSLVVLGAAAPGLAASDTHAGQIYTRALNILEAYNYHDMTLVSRQGPVVVAKVVTPVGTRRSVWVDTSTGIVVQGS